MLHLSYFSQALLFFNIPNHQHYLADTLTGPPFLRYLKVKYEDLVERQMEVTAKMFSFLGVPLTQAVKEFMKEHTSYDPEPTPVPQR